MKMVSWNMTRRCNLRCQHCYRDSGPEAGSPDSELSTEEGRVLLEDLAREDFFLVIFSGGEPLLREDLEELISYAEKLGLRPVLGTNAVELSRERIRSLARVGLKGMAVSLDSASPSGHDSFRGVEGCWQQAVDSAAQAVEEGIPVQINATISRQNRAEVDEMIELAREIGARSFHPFFLVPTGRGVDIEEDALRPDEYQEMIEYVLEKEKEVDLQIKPTCAPQFMVQAEKMDISLHYNRGCLAGLSYCCILPEGEVHVCPYLPVSAGSIREKSFSEIWRESKVFERLRDFSLYEGECGECGYVDICGGCRGRAYFYSEDDSVLASDPWCQVR